MMDKSLLIDGGNNDDETLISKLYKGNHYKLKGF